MSLKTRAEAAFGRFWGVSDLNVEVQMRQSSGFASAGDADEPRQDVVRQFDIEIHRACFP
jgi:hypothetical protein